MNEYPQLAPKQLTLVCSKCARTRTFGVGSDESADKTAQRIAQAGWIQRGGLTVCPKCPQLASERFNSFKEAQLAV